MQHQIQLARSIEKLSLNELVWLLQYIAKLIQQKIGITAQATDYVVEPTLLNELILAEDGPKSQVDETLVYRQKTIDQLRILRERLFTTYGQMDDSTELMRADRER